VQDSTERSVSIEENLLVPSRRLCRPANISALAPSTGVPKIAEMKATQCYWVFPVHIVLLLDAFVSMLIMENTISTFLIISAGRIEIVSRALYAKNINPVQSTCKQNPSQQALKWIHAVRCNMPQRYDIDMKYSVKNYVDGSKFRISRIN